MCVADECEIQSSRWDNTVCEVMGLDSASVELSHRSDVDAINELASDNVRTSSRSFTQERIRCHRARASHGKSTTDIQRTIHSGPMASADVQNRSVHINVRYECRNPEMPIGLTRETFLNGLSGLSAQESKTRCGPFGAFVSKLGRSGTVFHPHTHFLVVLSSPLCFCVIALMSHSDDHIMTAVS